MNYRSSCDSCQDTKVKCSQAKPTCQRCARKGLKCNYSPLRTIGRPRKRPTPKAARGRGAPEAVMLLEEQHHWPDVAITGRPSSGINHVLENTLLCPPPMLNSQTNISGNTSDTPEHAVNHRAVNGSSTGINPIIGRPLTIEAHGVFPGDTPSPGLVLSGDGEIQTATYCTDDWLGNCHQYPDFPIDWPSENTSAGTLDINYPWTSSNTVTEAATDREYHEDETRTLEAPSRHQFTIALDVMDPKTNCYVILLSRLTQIENTLATKPPEHPPPIDFTLGAETDLQNLKERIFKCQSHGSLNNTRAGTQVSSPCLSSSRPVLLVLCLLAERVVHLFEELFRRASILAQPFIEPPEMAFCPSTRRMKRTMRSLLDYSSACPFPDANRPLHIGRFGVSDEVKTRALRRILRGRIRGLLDMLGGMKHTTREAHGDMPGLVGSSAAASEAPGKIIEELYLRVESLMGRLDLTG